MNGFKTIVLMVTLTPMPVFAGGLSGGKTGITFVSYRFSDNIELRMYKAQEVTRDS